MTWGNVNFSYIMLHVCGQRSLFTSSRHANPHHLHMVSCIHRLNHAHCSKCHTLVSHHLLICGWGWKHGACNTTTTWIFTIRSYKSVWVPGPGQTRDSESNGRLQVSPTLKRRNRCYHLVSSMDKWSNLSWSYWNELLHTLLSYYGSMSPDLTVVMCE